MRRCPEAGQIRAVDIPYPLLTTPDRGADGR
jgi:hypothetical protein